MSGKLRQTRATLLSAACKMLASTVGVRYSEPDRPHPHPFGSVSISATAKTMSEEGILTALRLIGPASIP